MLGGRGALDAAGATSVAAATHPVSRHAERATQVTVAALSGITLPPSVVLGPNTALKVPFSSAAVSTPGVSEEQAADMQVRTATVAASARPGRFTTGCAR